VLYILLLVPGVFVSLSALGAYPPLDNRLVMAAVLGLFLLPVALQVLSSVRKRPIGDSGWLWAAYKLSILALVLLGFLLFLVEFSFFIHHALLL
jgi:hypothetical protein